MVTIETLLVARYAEAHPDGTLTIIGGGTSVLGGGRSDQPTSFAVAATLLSASPTGSSRQTVWCRMYGPDGQLAVEMRIDAELTSEALTTRRIPLAFNINGAFSQTGRYRIELSSADDLRNVDLDIVA